MSLHDVFSALENTAFATAIREGEGIFPWIESIHVLAITLVVGTISVIDLRLLGLPAHRRSVRQLMADVLPFTWGAFAFAVATGFLLFSSAAVKYSGELVFQVKMIVLVLAGANMAVFHLLTFRSIHLWDEMLDTPAAARLAGGGSLALWLCVVVFGRLIGFVSAP
jgi:hypothetical protein